MSHKSRHRSRKARTTMQRANACCVPRSKPWQFTTSSAVPDMQCRWMSGSTGSLAWRASEITLVPVRNGSLWRQATRFKQTIARGPRAHEFSPASPRRPVPMQTHTPSWQCRLFPAFLRHSRRGCLLRTWLVIQLSSPFVSAAISRRWNRSIDWRNSSSGPNRGNC